MQLSFIPNDTYTAIRIGSDYYISEVLAQEGATIEGAEVIRAKTDYAFSVDVNPSLTVTDSEGATYAKVVQSTFHVQFIAQLPPYNSI